MGLSFGFDVGVLGLGLNVEGVWHLRLKLGVLGLNVVGVWYLRLELGVLRLGLTLGLRL